MENIVLMDRQHTIEMDVCKTSANDILSIFSSVTFLTKRQKKIPTEKKTIFTIFKI